MRIPVTLTKYISKQFLINLGIVFAVIASIILLLETVEFIRRAADKNVPFNIIIEMSLLKFPFTSMELIPFVMLLGSMLTFAKLTRTSELAVMRAAGISVWQFLTPAILVAMLIGITIVTVINPLSSVMLNRFEKIEGKYLKGQTSTFAISSSGLWLRQTNEEKGQTLIHALRVSPSDLTLFDVTLFFFNENNTFTERVDAAEADLNDGYWRLHNALITAEGEKAKHNEEVIIPTTLKPAQIQESFASPETISFWVLPEFIETLENAGFSALEHRLHYNSVIASPFFYCAIVLIAAAFSLSLPRQGRTLIWIGSGIIVGLFLYAFPQFIGAIGLSGKIPVTFAAFAPVIITILLGVVLMLHLEDG